MIPKTLEEPDFFVNFFSHATVIVAETAPQLLPPAEPEVWKGNDEGSNSFEKAWAELSDAKKAAIAVLTARDSDVLLSPNASSPPAFPPLPVGYEIFVDEEAKFYAITSGSGPKKLAERDFWVSFFTHATAAL